MTYVAHTYVSSQQPENSSRDPIGYGAVILYGYVGSSPLSYLDPTGYCKEGWVGQACLNVKVKVSGNYFSESTSWSSMGIFAAAYFEGNVSLAADFSDAVKCCCPDRQIPVDIRFRLNLNYDYYLVNTALDLASMLARTLYPIWWLNGPINAYNGRSYLTTLEEAMKKDSQMAMVVGFSPNAICTASSLAGLTQLSGSYSQSATGLKSGRAPGQYTTPRRRVNLSFNFSRCYNSPQTGYPYIAT